MPKFDYAQLSLKERQALIEPLLEALWAMKNKDQLREFLTRLLTPSELIMLGRRLQIAENLLQGKSYETIRKETGVGFSTIQSVDSWLIHAVRDYHEIRAGERREAKRRQQHARNLKPRRRHRDPRWLLIDLLTQAATEAAIRSRSH